MSARGIVVTGTDTGIGKTLVARSLAAALAERGLRVHPLKPVETGCEERNGALVPADALALRAAARSEAPLEAVCPFRYAEPLAPMVAASRAGQAVDPERIRAAYHELADTADVVIVETAGGLLVPVTPSWSFADLARDLGLPLLLVVGSRLGAINQTLLTLECARARGLDVAGWVLNHPAPDSDLARETNAAALAELVTEPCLATVPWLASTDDGTLRAAGESLARALGFGFA